MLKMSRVGRKALMFKAIMAHDRKHKGGALTTPQMAHAAGLMSSSNVLSMLRELEQSYVISEVQIEPTYQCGYTVRAWRITEVIQMPLPERYIKITSGRSNNRIEEMVKNA